MGRVPLAHARASLAGNPAELDRVFEDAIQRRERELAREVSLNLQWGALHTGWALYGRGGGSEWVGRILAPTSLRVACFSSL